MNLYELLEYAQKREMECCYVIVKKFDKLIKKYAKKLNYEDAESDLICYFVELIYTFPLEKFKKTDEGRIVSYIVRCVKNHYILLLKKLIKTKQEINMSEMSTEQQFILESQLITEDHYDSLFLMDIKSVLSEKEWIILKLIYIQGLSSTEVAVMEGVTRQAVNQAKIRILAKLRRIYFINSNFLFNSKQDIQ